MSQKYYLLSENTKFHPVTNNEADGAFVATLNGNLSSLNSLFTFSRPVEGPVPALVTITGPKGYYVALPDGAGENTRLIWSKDEYYWTVSAINGAGNELQAYQIYPANGNNLYWVDKTGIGNFIIVLAGDNINPPENFWYLKAHSE